MFMDGERELSPSVAAYTQFVIYSLEVSDPNNPTFSDYTDNMTVYHRAWVCLNEMFDAAFGEATIHVCLYELVGNVVGRLPSVVKTRRPRLELTTTFRDNLGIF